MHFRLRNALVALVTLTTITCTDAPTGLRSAPARIRLSPRFTADAAKIYNSLALFGQEVTEVRIVLTAPDGTLRDTVVVFPDGVDELSIDIPVPAGSTGQQFSALIELRNDQHAVLFSGTQQVTARVEHTVFVSEVAEIHYTGPGRGTKTVTVLPDNAEVTASGTVPFQATGVDSAGNPVTDLLVRWTSSDPTLAVATTTGNSTGTVVGQGRRGTVTISAITPAGITGTTRLTLLPVAARLVVVSGGGQTTVAGSAAPQPFVVEVQGTDNLPVVGAPVTFRAVTTGGVTPASLNTDATGRASTTMRLGNVAGVYQFEAASAALTPVTVSVTATPAAAAALTIVSGNSQADSVGRPLAQPLVVRVTDAFGGPVNGATVSFTKESGAGTVSSPSVVTGSDGLASTAYTLGPVVGTDVVRASVAGVSGAAGTVTFSMETIAGGVNAISIVSGGGQSGQSGATLPSPIVARVEDALGNPLPNVSVVWGASGSGTIFTPPTSSTAANGEASTTATLGSTIGAGTVTASVGARTATAPMTILAPPTMTLAAGNLQTATAGTAVAIAPSVLVKDGAGNPVAGVEVVFAVESGGGSVTGATTTTTSSGIATVGSWTLGSTAGRNTLTATSGALSTTFVAVATSGAATRFLFVQAPPASIVVGGAPITVRARLLDALDNPVVQAGVVVTGTATASPGPGGGVFQATTDAAGVATFTLPSYVGAVGTLTFTLSAPGFAALASSPVPVLVGAPAGLAIVTQPAATAQAGVSLSPQPVIQVVDAGGNPVSQSGLSVTATIATGGGTLGGSAVLATGANGQVGFANLSLAGSTGSRTLAFSSSGLTSATSGTIAVSAGPAASIALVTGDGQQATAGSPVAVSPSVKVSDAFGNGVAGTVVTFTAVTSGSRVSNGGPLGTSATVTTNSAGVASLAQWVLGNTAQAYTLSATAAVASGSPVTFTADAVAATGSVLALTTPPSAAATNGVVLGAQPVIQLKDVFGNPVATAGVVVTAAITSGSGALSNATATTVAGGSATFDGLTITGTVGDFVLQFSAPTYTPVTSAPISLSVGALASLVVTPNSAVLTPGATQQFSAVGTDAQGNVVSITPTWTVVAGGGAISAGGLFTAGNTAGSYANTVVATSGAVSGSASVTVNAGALASITVAPSSTALTPGATQQFTAVGKDAQGNVVSITPTWTVVAGGGAISAGGLFTAGNTAGSYANTVVATSGSVSGTASVTVTPGALASITVAPGSTTLTPGGTQQFTAVGKDAQGNVVSITPTWTVVAGGGAISAGGLFTAGNTAGSYANTVQATSGSVSGTASVTVVPGALASITVAPSSTTLTPGATQQFTAVGKDAQGNVVSITPTWTVVAGGGAISAGGLFTAGNTAGSYANTVAATSGSVSGTASVTVTPGALASITISPSSTTLTPGATQQFTAVGKDAQGNVVSITPTWTVVAGGGAISAAGLFTAGNTAGDFANTIKATSGALSGTASVTVTPGALASITVSPNPTTLTPGETQQFTAVGQDAQGNVVSIAPTWTVVAGGGAISAGGLFTAGNTAGDFANTVKATSGSVSGTASVTVIPGALASITVSPNPAALTPGGTQQFTAVGRDAQSNIVAITPTWSVVASGGTISASGLFTAGSTAGSYANTVQATSGSVSGTASVTVNPGALASITVSPNPAALTPGGTQQFTAVGRDAQNNIVTITPTWSVVASGGTISASGLFTAGATAGSYANTVQATSGAVSGTASVTVNAGALASITVTPNPASLTPGATQQFTAIGRDAQNNIVTITPTWSVVAGGGEISAGGLFIAGNTAGSYANTVQASSGAISGAASVTVAPGALASITVTPNSATLTPGATQQFTAVGKDAQGNVVSITPTWTVVAGGGAIGAGGLFTAGNTAGSYGNTVQATSGAVSGTASVTVSAGALASITVAPSSTTLTPGATQQFTAVGTDAQGNVVSITPTWSVVAGGGTISVGGLFTAGNTAGSYANTVQASSGSVSGNASVTVAPGALASITVAPSSTTLTPGETQQFTAVGTDAQGNVVSITPTWSVVAGGGAISANGLFTAGNTAGSYASTVAATSGPVSGTASVTVTPGALASITVAPSSTTLTPGATQQFTAVGKDAQGNVVSIAPTWSVVASGGTISVGGLFTAGNTAGSYANTVVATSGAVSSSASVTVTAGALASITVAPSSTTLTPGANQQFTAVGKDAQGNVVSITPTWTVVAGGGAIGAGGLFTAGNTAGSYANTVQASSGSVSGTASVTVNAGALASITVTPNPTTLTPGETQQFTAIGRDAQNNIVAITPTWSVVAGGGAISAGGLFTAGNTAGNYANTVQATSGAVSGTASVTVSAGALASITVAPSSTTLTPGGTQQFTAVGADAQGNVVSITPTWTVAAGGGAISAAGLFTAGNTAGDFANTIKATSGALSGTASVTVTPGALASITVTPNSSALTPGATQQFTAVGKDAQGNVTSITPTWSVVASGGTINAAGLFTAGNTAGDFANTVKATSGSVSGTASVTVIPGALASITITPNPSGLTPGATQQFTAVGRDAQNNIVAITPTWSVVAKGGTISASGLFTAGSTAGSYANTVQATSGSVSGTASVTVNPGALASITVTPSPATLTPGGTQQFTAVGRDAQNNIVAITPTWSVIAGGGEISAGGLFTAGNTAGSYANTVQASSGAISGAASVTVAPGALASITVTPNSATLTPGATQQFTAVGQDAQGNVVSITPTWSVVAGGGAIGAGGLFTAGNTAGRYANTVVATSGAVSGSASVTVSAGALASITVAPSSTTLTPGGTQQFTAVGQDAQGNVVSITPTWSVVAGGGTISAGGLFTAGSTADTYTNTVQATSGAISGVASVTVNPGALASIVVSPNPTSLATGGTRTFTAVGRDASNNVVAITPTWSVVAGGGSIDAAGTFTAGKVAGNFANTVQAASGSISGTASVTVNAGNLASITITPNPAALAPGATQQFTAIGKDADDNVVTLNPTWSVGGGGGTINSNGLFTAGTSAGTFTNTVQATRGAVVGTATVTINPGPLASITITPSPAVLTPGATKQFTAIGKDAQNNVVPISPTWSVVADGGTISASGLFTAGSAAGSYVNTVQATGGSVSGTASVTVNPGALASITVTPNPATLTPGATQQFTAVGKDAQNNIVTITPTWSVVASGGTISAGGLFTAGSAAGSYANTVQATSGAISGTASVTVTPGALASITVTPSPATLTPGATQQFTAVGKDAQNNIVTITPAWSVVASGGTISASGLFTAGSTAGSYANTVQATSGAISGTASVTVTPGALASITVTPSPATLTPGATQQFTAVGRDAQNNIVAITPTWSVVASGGTIDAAGLFTAGNTAGDFSSTIKATSGSVSGTASVTVIPGALASITVSPNPAALTPGATQQFTAVGKDAQNNIVAITPTWSVVASGGSISGTGLFTAGTTAGSYANTVQATSGSVSGTASVTVNPGALASIIVTPNPATLTPGATQQFTAVGKDAQNNIVTITPTWSVVASGGTISASGLFTAGSTAGSYANTVQATSGAISGTASVTVNAGALASITVTPNSTTLTPGETQQFTAVGKDAQNNIVTITPTWSVVASGGTIDAAGLFTAGNTAGDFANTVKATSGAVSGTASVTVIPGALASITVSPNPVALTPGATQQFTAVGKDAQNNIVAISPTWSVVASGGTIDAAGLFTAGNTAGDFANTIKATSGAVSGTASVTLTPGALASITVTPNPTTLTPGATAQFSAVGTDAQGNIVAITPTWSIVASGGTISANGLFTAGSTAGSYANTVQATSGAVSGTASVTVNAGALASITVTPNPTTLTPGETQQFTAIGRDAQNNIVAITPTWSVVASGGTIDAAGLFTAGNTAGDFAKTVKATSGSVSGTASVTVNPGALASITVTPSPATLTPGGTQQFTAVGKDAQNNIVAITPTWSVVASGGSISGTGLFTAGTTPGSYANTVQATSGSVSGTASVTVIPGALASITVSPNPVALTPGATAQFSAVGTDAQGNIVAITPTWSIVASGGTISASGLFTAGSTAGSYANTVQATSGAISGTASVTVNAGALASITITPSPATLTPGATQQFTAVGKDAQNNIVAITPTWSVVASGGTISSSGLFTAGGAAGTYANTVQATSGSVSGTASVTVIPGALASITVTPSEAKLTPGATAQFSAVGKDAQNNIVAITPTWSIVAQGGTINTSGLFTAGSTAGSYANTVQASSGGIVGTASVTVDPGALATITVTPSSTSLTPGATQQFSAVGKDAQGNVVTITPTWSVVASGGTIDGSGLFTAGSLAGNYANTVQATSGVISGTASVTVTPGALASITITPNPASLTPGATQQFSAVGKDAQNNIVAITPTWSVVASGGTITASGVFTAGTAAGSFPNTVQATSGAISGTASVNVIAGALASISIAPSSANVPAGGTQRFVAIGKDANDNDVAISPTWSVIAGGGTIDADGLFTASRVAGRYANTVQATSGSVSATASVTVNSGNLATITISPNPATLLPGATQQFTAVGKDADDNIVAINPTWSVEGGSGTISSSGLFTAGATANTFANSIVATRGTVVGTATVTITPGPLATITVTPNPATVTPGATQQFTAVGRDAQNNVVAITPTWSVVAGGGSMSASGLFTAGSLAGSYANTVQATSGAVSGSASVTVTPGALASITVTPTPATLTPGATQQFTAVGKDAQNNVVSIAPTWSVVAGGGSIDEAGLFTAGNAAGSYANTVNATSGPISGTASVTVNPGALASITITPNPATLTPGATQQFTAVGRDAQNNVVAITPTWSVVASGGTIDNAGLFTAGNAAGSYSNTVNATSGAVSGSASVVITPGALASITVAPTPATLTPGTTQQFTAVGKDAQGNVVTIAPTWSVVAGGGSIDANGLFTAGSAAGSYVSTVTATSGAVNGVASVTINPGTLASITITPDPATLTPGSTQQFTAVGKDAQGNVVTITPTWSVVAGGGAIDNAGLFTAGNTAGSFASTVKVASGAMSSTASVTVIPGALASITVTPNPATLTPGATQQFTAVGKDAQNNIVSITPTWSVVASGGTIDNAGLFTAGSTAGSYASTVQATSGPVSGSASVTVTPGTLASIIVTPSSATLTPGVSQQFSAVGKDAQNNIVSITPTWAVVAGGGTIDNAGLFTAGSTAGSYANTVQATSGAISGTASVTVIPGALASITITPNPATLTPGATQQFTAVGKDAQNNIVSITPTWSVVASGGAIDNAGLFTAGNSAGTYTNTVQATSGAITGSASVTVNPGSLASITITPTPATLTPGATRQFTADGKDAQGNVVSIAPTWSVVSGGGTIDNAGLFTAGNTAGSYANTIQATSGAISGTATVTVNPGALASISITPNPATLTPGGTQQFSAVGKDAQSNVVAITPTWSVVASGGSIDNAGLFTAGNAAGTYANTVTATSGVISGTATVTVNPGALASITVSPNPATLTPGVSQQFTAVGKDAQNNVVAITPTWSVVAGGGSIDASGLFTADNTAGSYTNTVQATSGAVSGSTSVTVTPGALASITITPNPATLTPGAGQQFTAVGKDAQNNVVAITPTWSVVAGGGTIDNAGLFTAGNTAGSYSNTVTATSGAISGTATVTVNPGALASITITPNPATLTPGVSQQFSAVGKDAQNNVVAITPTWSVVAGGGAIDNAGLFTAGNTAGTYTNTVTATSGAISGTATVTVNPGALASITITPNPATLTPGVSQQFSAVGKDAQNNVVAITPTWSVVAGGGTIDDAGLFTAGTTAGSYANTVKATSGSISGTASVTVNPGALASITITPSPATLTPGATQQFTAVGKDAQNNVVAITPTWSVAANGGTIDDAGLFTAGNTAGSFANAVTATSGAVSGSASVTVIPGALASITITPAPTTLTPGAIQQFTAVGKDAQDNVVTISPTWSVVASGGTINSSGLFTAGNLAGTYSNTVRATSGSISGTASVTVNPGALASITISPTPTTLATRTTQQFTAVGKDAQNNIVTFTPTWSVVSGGGTIDADGLFTAGITAGFYLNTIKATSGSISATSSVIIIPGILASITITPNPVTLAQGATQQFTAVGRDANNNVVPFTPTWSVSDGGGTITESGLFTAGTIAGTFTGTVRAAGPAILTNALGTISGSATVIVSEGALASITVSPSSANIPIGGTQTFTAVGKDANNNTVAITPTWSVIAGGGSIDAAGVFTAGRVAGHTANTVQASSGDISGTASVTINAGNLATITISPNPATLLPGATQQFTAVGKDADGNVVSINPTWSIDGEGGTITNTGLFTAGATAGTFANSIRATRGTVVGTATVTVTPGALATITITPGSPTLTPGAAQQFTAVGKDAQDNVVVFTPTWSVAAGGGSINASGLFTAATVAGTFANTVEVTNGTVVGKASVVVSPGALRTITVSPSTVNLAPGATQQFTAVGKDTHNNIVPITPTWSVASGGTIDSNGLFTAGATIGTFEDMVRASVDKTSGGASVRVVAGALASITIAPSPATLTSRGTQQFSAVGRDASGNIVPVTVAWSVVAGGGTIDESGLFTAGAVAGSFENTVLATSGDISGQASVIVATGAAAGLAFITQPASTSLGMLFRDRVSVALVDAAGNVVTSNSSDHVTIEITNGTGAEGATMFFAGAQFPLRNGVVTMNPLWIDAVGSNYTLTARTNLGFSVVSNPFSITKSQLASIAVVAGRQLVRTPSQFVSSEELVIEGRTSTGEPVGEGQIIDLYYLGEGYACGGVGGTIATDAGGHVSYYASLGSGAGQCEIQFTAPGSNAVANARIAVIDNRATHVWMAGLDGDDPGFDRAANWIKVSSGANDVPSAENDTPFFPAWSTRITALAQSSKTLGGLILDGGTGLDLSNYTFTTNGDISMGSETFVLGEGGQIVAKGHDVNITGGFGNLTLGSAGSCTGFSADRAIVTNFVVEGTLQVVCGAHLGFGYASNVNGVAGSFIKVLSSEATMNTGNQFSFAGDSLVLENSASLHAGSATIGGRLFMGNESSLRISGNAVFNGTGRSLAGNISTGDVTFGGAGSAGYTFTGGTLSVFGTFSQVAGSTGATFVADANHLTEIAAEGSSAISFANPSESMFGNLRLWSSTSLGSDLVFPSASPLTYLELAGGSFSVGEGRRVTLPGELVFSGGQLALDGTMYVGGCSFTGGFTVGTTVSGRGIINDTPASSFRACQDNSVSDRLPLSGNRIRSRPVALKLPMNDARRVRRGTTTTPAKVVRTKVTLRQAPK